MRILTTFVRESMDMSTGCGESASKQWSLIENTADAKSDYGTAVERLSSSTDIEARSDQRSIKRADIASAFPETAPLLLPQQGFRVPRDVWECIYSILRETHSECGDNSEWIPIHRVQIEFARRMRRPLSVEYLKRVCGVKSLKQFFIDNPWTGFQMSEDNLMCVKLTRPSHHSKPTALIDVKPRKQKKSSVGNKEGSAPMEYDEDEDDLLMVPSKRQLPDGVFVSQSLRQRIYSLLLNRYPRGTDICTFSEAYTKRYGMSLAPANECLGIQSMDYLFQCIDDIVRSEIGPGRILWVKPIDSQEIRDSISKKMNESGDVVPANKQTTTPSSFFSTTVPPSSENLCRKEEEVKGETPCDSHKISATISQATALPSFRERITEEFIQLVNDWPSGIAVENLASYYGEKYPGRGIGKQQSNQMLRVLQNAAEVNVFRQPNGVWCVKPKDSVQSCDTTMYTALSINENDNGSGDKPIAPTALAEQAMEAQMAPQQQAMGNGNGKRSTPIKVNARALQAIIRRNVIANAVRDKQLERRALTNYNALNATDVPTEDAPMEDAPTEDAPTNKIDELYLSVHKLLLANKNGIRLVYLPVIYEGCFGNELNLDGTGFDNLEIFLRACPGLFTIQEASSPEDVFVYATKTE